MDTTLSGVPKKPMEPIERIPKNTFFEVSHIKNRKRNDLGLCKLAYPSNSSHKLDQKSSTGKLFNRLDRGHLLKQIVQQSAH